MDTSGALLLSNDGDFIYRVTHPKHEIEKKYIVTVNGNFTNNELEQLKNGIKIKNNDEEYITKPAKVKKINSSCIEITIHEGKNRQIRKMCEAVGKKVLSLHRSYIGALSVNDLKIGEWRYLSEKDLKSIEKNY